MEFYGIPKSKIIKGLKWLGERLPYPEKDIKGDSYPMTWAYDDNIYASAGDPNWGESPSGLDVERFAGGPTDYKITQYNPMKDFVGWGGVGPKPSGMICVDGVFYLAVQNIFGQPAPHSKKSQPGCNAHILSCYNGYNQWYPAYRAIEKPMFPGSRFGGPAFINFGKNNANARDEYIYAVSGDQWDNGSNVRLGRVHKEHIMEINYWEYVCAFDKDGAPAWNGSLDEAIPILSIHRFIGMPEMVYLAGIKRYLFLTWRLREDFHPEMGTDLLILESPEPWGPFSLAHFEEFWESKEFTPYCPRMPLKWMEDDITGYMQFSGSWSPEGAHVKGYYRSNVRKFKLEL